VRLHRALNTVALDLSCFVKMSVQFGGGWRQLEFSSDDYWFGGGLG
jgi:hypothetical protein